MITSSYGSLVLIFLNQLIGSYESFSGTPDIPYIISYVLVCVFVYDVFRLVGVLFRA